MSKTPTLAFWQSGVAMATMLGEAQIVIALRMAGVAGLWTLAPGETARMVSEKQQAFAEAARDMTAAALQGQHPERILDAAIRPVGRRTRANARRLARAWSRR